MAALQTTSPADQFAGERSTDDILAEMFPRQTIMNLREGVERGTFGPFAPQQLSGGDGGSFAQARRLAELRRLRRQGRQGFGADPTFNADRAVLSMFDELDEGIQARAARGDYGRAGSQDELAYMMGFDIEARKYEADLDDDGMALADAITEGKFSPRAITVNQSIRKLMQPLHDSVLSQIPVPESQIEAVDAQTAVNGFMSDAQRIIEAQPDDESKQAVVQELIDGMQADADFDESADALESEFGAVYQRLRNRGLVFASETTWSDFLPGFVDTRGGQSAIGSNLAGESGIKPTGKALSALVFENILNEMSEQWEQEERFAPVQFTVSPMLQAIEESRRKKAQLSSPFTPEEIAASKKRDRVIGLYRVRLADEGTDYNDAIHNHSATINAFLAENPFTHDDVVEFIAGLPEDDPLRKSNEITVRRAMAFKQLSPHGGFIGEQELVGMAAQLKKRAEYEREIADIEQETARITPNPDRGVFGEFLAGLRRGVGTLPDQFVGGTAGWIGALLEKFDDDVIGQTMADTFRQFQAVKSAQVDAEQARTVMSDSDSTAVNLAGAVGGGVPQITAQVLAAVATGGGSVYASLATFSATSVGAVMSSTYNEEYKRLRSEGLEHREAADLALKISSASGGITAATNMVPGVALLRKTPVGNALLSSVAKNLMKKRFLQFGMRAATAGAGEAFQEMTEQVLQDTASALVRNDPLNRDADYWRSILFTGAAASFLGAGAGVAVEFSMGSPDVGAAPANAETVGVDQSAKEFISNFDAARKIFREKHVKAAQFVDNASPETLAKVRAKWVGRAANEPAVAGFVNMIDTRLAEIETETTGAEASADKSEQESAPPASTEKGDATEAAGSTETAPDAQGAETPATTTEQDGATATDANSADDATKAPEPDEYAVRANDRGTVEGKYRLPKGVLEFHTPSRLRQDDGWGVKDLIAGVTDSLRPLTWAEAVAEADRRNLEMAGVEGAVAIKPVAATETAPAVEAADVTPEPRAVEPAVEVDSEVDVDSSLQLTSNIEQGDLIDTRPDAEVDVQAEPDGEIVDSESREEDPDNFGIISGVPNVGRLINQGWIRNGTHPGQEEAVQFGIKLAKDLTTSEVRVIDDEVWVRPPQTAPPKELAAQILVPDPPVDGDSLPNAQEAAEIVWYHGSRESTLTLGNVSSGESSISNLFGPGLYMTDNPNIAASYARTKTKGITAALYEVRINPRAVVNFEQPLTPEVFGILESSFGSLDEDVLDAIRTAAAKPGATGADVWNEMTEAVSDFSHDARVSADEISENFVIFEESMRLAGFDAITHAGGILAGGGKTLHRVMILIDPKNLSGFDQSQFPETITSFKRIGVADQDVAEPAAAPSQDIAPDTRSRKELIARAVELRIDPSGKQNKLLKRVREAELELRRLGKTEVEERLPRELTDPSTGKTVDQMDEDDFIDSIIGTKEEQADSESAAGMETTGELPDRVNFTSENKVSEVGKFEVFETRGRDPLDSEFYAFEKGAADSASPIGVARGDRSQTFVAVSEEGFGVGSELVWQLRKNHPFRPSGGLSSGGVGMARRFYRRFVEESVAPDTRTRRELVERAKELGIKATGKKPDILERVQLAEAGDGVGEVGSPEVVATRSELSDEPDVIKEAVTGKPITVAKLFRGFGDRDQRIIAPMEAVLGAARYSSVSSIDALAYGPKVEELTVTLKNPYVIDGIFDLESLIGVEPFPSKRKDEGNALLEVRAELIARGHDGVIVNLPENTDVALDGTDIEHLRAIFDITQVVEFFPPITETTPQTTDPDAPNFDRRGFTLNFAAEAADAVLKGGSYTFRAIRDTVSRMLSGLSSRVHGLYDKIVHLTSRIVGRSVKPDGTIDTEAQAKAVLEADEESRLKVNPTRGLYADRQDIESVGRLRNLSPAIISGLHNQLGILISRATGGKRYLPSAQIMAAKNGVIGMLYNLIEDTLVPLKGHLDGSGMYTGDRMARTFEMISIFAKESQELRQELKNDVTVALGQSKLLRTAGAAVGMPGLQREAEKIANTDLVCFRRMKRAERRLDDLKKAKQPNPKAITRQDLLVESLAARVEADNQKHAEESREGILKAFEKFDQKRHEQSQGQSLKMDASKTIDAVSKAFSNHAVVQIDPEKINSAVELDALRLKVMGLPEPDAAIDPTENPIQPGVVVQAHDRENFGHVIQVDQEAKTALVRFVNPQTGSTATLRFTFDRIEVTNDAPVLLPTRKRMNGAKEVSTIEFKTAAQWKADGLDADTRNGLAEIIDILNAAQMAVQVDPNTPRINDLVADEAAFMADIDTAEFINGKRREAVNNHFLALANTELGLEGETRLKSWEDFMRYARVHRHEAGIKFGNKFSEQQQRKAESAFLDLVGLINGEILSRQDAPGIAEVIFDNIDRFSTGAALVFAGFSTAPEVLQTMSSILRHGGAVRGIGNLIRAISVNLSTAVPVESKAMVERLAEGIVGLHEYGPNRGQELFGEHERGEVIGGGSKSTSQMLNESPSVMAWLLGGLEAGTKLSVEKSVEGKVFGVSIPGQRQTSLDFLTRQIRRVGLLGELGIFSRSVMDLQAVSMKLRTGEAENAGDAIKQLKKERKLRTKISGQYYSLVITRIGHENIDRLAERMESGEGITRMFGMNMFTGNAAEDLALKRYMDFFLRHEATNTPRKSDIPFILQKANALSVVSRIFLKFLSQSNAAMSGAIKLRATGSTRSMVSLIAIAYMGGTMFEMFLRDVVRRGWDGAVKRFSERADDPKELSKYLLEVGGRANVFGPAEKIIVPVAQLMLEDNGYKRQRIIDRSLIGLQIQTMMDIGVAATSIPSLVRGEEQTAASKRRLRRLAQVSSDPLMTLLRNQDHFPDSVLFGPDGAGEKKKKMTVSQNR